MKTAKANRMCESKRMPTAMDNERDYEGINEADPTLFNLSHQIDSDLDRILAGLRNIRSRITGKDDENHEGIGEESGALSVLLHDCNNKSSAAAILVCEILAALGD